MVLQWCAQNKAKCDEFGSPDNDFSKRALGDASSTDINVNSTLSIREANELDKRDGWNYVPLWVMCAGPQGQNPVMYSKAQIVAAIAEAVNLFAQRLQTPPTRNGYTYPKPYHQDINTPDLGHANRQLVFPACKLRLSLINQLEESPSTDLKCL